MPWPSIESRAAESRPSAFVKHRLITAANVNVTYLNASQVGSKDVDSLPLRQALAGYSS